MIVWLIQPGEPLPIEGPTRPWRTGLLAEELTRRGHEVLWWSSAFSHARKRFICRGSELVTAPAGYQIQLLAAIAYRKNISLRRIISYRGLARSFRRLSQQRLRPDVIVSSYPNIELSRAAVELGERWSIPVVLDICDLWPDIFVDLAPHGLHWLARAILFPMFRDAAVALRSCDSIMAVSDGYLQWALQRAGRSATDQDLVLHLGYAQPEVDRQTRAGAARSLRERGVDPEKTIAWFIGVFGHTYDLQTVVEAARRCQDLQQLQIVLSGDGEQMASLQRLTSGLSNVLLTGWVDAAEIACLMDWSQIGLAAYGERAPQGLPNKIFEYLCAGIAILSSLRGESEALLVEHECGLSYSSADQLADRLHQLCTRPQQLQNMADRARQLFTQSFDARHIYPRMADHVEQLGRNG
jgi:glycosyltransferase involved in cell wall biosynthesis